MEYVDLNLHVTPGADGKFNVSAKTEDLGGLDTEMELPVQLEELAGFVFGVAESLREARVVGSEDSSEGVPSDPEARKAKIREFGARLYSSLIQGEIQSLLDKLGVLHGSPDTGIRIRLSMDLSRDGMKEVASLPWELITKEGSNVPLVLSKQTVLVRSLSVPQPTEPAPFEPPLRILVVSANPKDTQRLDLSEERERIQRTWGKLPGVRVEFAGPTYDSVREYLAGEDPHVVHFMGHGEFDAERGGTLLFEDENGNADFVGGDRLQILFSDETRLQLVFLNACKTAADRNSESLDPFAGVAASLIQIGVTAVVAMQFPISDDAAVKFSDTFYKHIAAGDPVDTAVAHARRALYGAKKTEWVTPVLFMRSKDGRIFDKKAAAAAPEPDAPPTVFLAATADSLRRHYRQIAAGLEADGIKVLDPIPEPYEATAHEAAVRAAVKSADLCVHLLGDRPGEAVEDDDQRTYPLEQLRIALESARSQLVLMPEQFDVDTIEDAKYREVLKSLAARSRDPNRMEFMKIGAPQMLDEVRLKIQKLKVHKPSLSAACIDLHSSDLAHATDLIDYLTQREVAPLMQPSTESTPTEVMDAFISNLKTAPLLLVVFGNAPREWVIGRLLWAQRQKLLKNLDTEICVFATGSDKAPDQLQFSDFKTVSGIGGLDPAEIDALIAAATQ